LGKIGPGRGSEWFLRVSEVIIYKLLIIRYLQQKLRKIAGFLVDLYEPI
jgi:hypothetical protein